MINGKDYNNYYQMLLKDGFHASPRGHKTTRMWDVQVVFRTLEFPRRERGNPAIGIIEGLQFIGGIFNKNAIVAAAPGAKHELFNHQSAYGPRVGDQFKQIVETLREDRESRRAQLIIADGKDEKEDLPCTTSMLFRLYGDDALFTSIYMRSSDAVWGLPYDLIQFGMVSNMIASCVGAYVQNTVLTLGDAHVYEATAYSGVWETDSLILPRFKTVNEWQDWAISVSDAKLSQKELESRFVASKATPEMVYAMRERGGLS